MSYPLSPTARRCRFFLLLGAALAPVLGGCQFAYVWKQAFGQWRLSGKQVDLEAESLKTSLAEDHLAKLDWVPRILEFARSELDLLPGDTYQTFLDTRGEPISHIVMAAHPAALIPYEWCFPFVG
jgi:predicted aminopeptidase